MKLSISASGEPYGTKVINADTGEELEDVLYIKIEMNAADGGVPHVLIGVTDLPLVVSVDEAEFKPSGFTGHIGE